ncbi:hypothetical protein NW765_017157 [Fusarium oxysporum]|nr:hypothetical protein NW765_017157 [Fusarium oxysporum]
MAPPSVPTEVKKQRERDRGRNRREQSRCQGQAERLREADSHESVRLVSQVHHTAAGATDCRSREHSLLGDPAVSSAGGRHLLQGNSDFEDASLGNDTSLHDCPSAANMSLAVPVAHSPKDAGRTRSVFYAEADGTEERRMLERTTFESAATPGHSNTDKEYFARDSSCPAQNGPATSPVPLYQAVDAQKVASNSGRNRSSSPISEATSDYGYAPFDADGDHDFRTVDSCSISPSRPSKENPSLPIDLSDRMHVYPHLHSFVDALRAQETRCGLEILKSQTATYERIFQTFFSAECHCKSGIRVLPATAHDSSEISDRKLPQVQFLRGLLPPLNTIFDERFAHGAANYLHQWKAFLSDEPVEPLSFHKTEASLEHGPVRIERRWDIDSIWFGPKSLQAVRKPGIFRLSFMPPFKRNLSTDQVIRPHGLDLATTRHILFGPVNTSGIRFDVYLFFPGASKTSASRNGLSLDRQKDLYDSIIIPAAFSSISDPLRQELPGSFDIAYAKSRSFQERPETGRWRAGDDGRACHLQYTLPTDDLGPFWSSIVQRANSFRVQTKAGNSVAYFKNPQLLFQAHDLKKAIDRGA